MASEFDLGHALVGASVPEALIWPLRERIGPFLFDCVECANIVSDHRLRRPLAKDNGFRPLPAVPPGLLGRAKISEQA
jgi:hypothetical protein